MQVELQHERERLEKSKAFEHWKGTGKLTSYEYNRHKMQVAYVYVYSLVTGNPHPGETSSYIPNEDNAPRHTGDISGNIPFFKKLNHLIMQF